MTSETSEIQSGVFVLWGVLEKGVRLNRWVKLWLQMKNF